MKFFNLRLTGIILKCEIISIPLLKLENNIFRIPLLYFNIIIGYYSFQGYGTMFEILIEKLNTAFKNLITKGKLSEKDIDEGLRQIRLALLEADVNFKVVKVLLERVRDKALASLVLQSLTPGQQIIKILNDELINIFGNKSEGIILSNQTPTIIMLVGLQGSGKTTTAMKLAAKLKNAGHFPLLVAADTRRPAAIDQLTILGKQINIPVYTEYGVDSPMIICNNALKKSRETGSTILILDTQGRLHVDDLLMKELIEIKNHIKPHEILLVIDAMTGQEAVKIAEEFNKNLGLTGLILTKIDGDARGGAALSIRFVTGVPIKYIGTGEKSDALEVFHPDRVASRIIGMGDILTLIEKAQDNIDQQHAKKLEKKIRRNEYDLEDFLEQLKQLKKMGPISQVIQMLPGASKLSANILDGNEEGQIRKIEAIISSMTSMERRSPDIINGSRRKRIALGSGTATKDVNQLLNQFTQVKKIAKMTSQGKLPKNYMDVFKNI